MIIKLINKITIILLVFSLLCSCEDVDGKLNQYLENGPIIYTAKMDSLVIESGYYRARVNFYPAPDANLSYAQLIWNKGRNSQDTFYDKDKSLYDENRACFYTILDFTEDGLQGDILFEALNYDKYENKSITLTKSKLIYGDSYLSGLTNTVVSSIENMAYTNVDSCTIIFDPKAKLVGVEISYETPTDFVTEKIYKNPITLGLKPGSTTLSYKSLYHINSNDLDTLVKNTAKNIVIPKAM